jgi:hypothetical protein
MYRSFQAGSAKVNITPPLTIPYLGYEPRHAFFEGVHDPLYARAVALDDGTRQALIIAADSIGYSNALLGPGRNFTSEVRQRIQERTGIPAAHIMLTTSHAHSTPETCNLRRLLDTPAAAPWLEVVIDQLTSVASIAFSRRQPSRMKVATGEVSGLSRNRRVVGLDGRIVGGAMANPTEVVAGKLDQQVGMILFESIDNATCTLLANFACHPVTVQVQPLVSADFPGAAMTLVEKTLPGCTNSLFLQGACGNINPIRNTTDFDDVERYGLMLGSEVIKQAARASAPDYPTNPPQLAILSEIHMLKVRDLPEHTFAKAAYDHAAAQLSIAATEEERVAWRRRQRVAEETLILIEQGREPIPAEVQVIRIGDVALVALPGEPFVELGLEIKERSTAPYTFVVGYSNDWIGYLTTSEAWEQGGYEVSAGPWTRVGPEGGPQLVNAALKMIQKLWA